MFTRCFKNCVFALGKGVKKATTVTQTKKSDSSNSLKKGIPRNVRHPEDDETCLVCPWKVIHTMI